MPPALLAFYAMAAHRRQQAKSGMHWTQDMLADEYMYYYRQAVNPNSGTYERTEVGIRNGISQQFIEQKKSKVNRRIVQTLGERMAQPYLLIQQQNMQGTQFRLIGINVKPENIRIG